MKFPLIPSKSEIKMPGIGGGLFSMIKNTIAEAPLSPIAKEIKEAEAEKPGEITNPDIFMSGDEEDDDEDDEKEL